MKREYADHYSALEQHHWWFRARRKILRDLLALEIGWRDGMQVLEIGVGPGENLYTLYPANISLMGMEPDPNNVQVAQQRGPIPVYAGTIEDLPPPIRETTFDAIGLFDVLEHIKDDEAALCILRDRLKPGGKLVLAVPTYQWMWGLQDEVSLHYRRYTRAELCNKLRDAGFRIQRATYFNTFLFPMIAVFRLAGKLMPASKRSAQSDFDYSAGPINELFCAVFGFERHLLRVMNFPFGVSAFVIAEAPPQ
jgi:SAM-dependent methyltransferase